MKEVFSAFGSEVFRPLVTLVLPGVVATSTGWIAALWARGDFRSFADHNHAEIIGAALAGAIIIGLVCEDVGARVETFWDDRHKDGHREEWYDYLRQAFRIEPVGHRYMSALVLRLKFELGMCVATIFAIMGLWWFPTTLTARVICTAIAVVASAYFRWEAWTSHETLHDLRHELLQGINVVPADEPSAFRVAAE